MYNILLSVLLCERSNLTAKNRFVADELVCASEGIAQWPLVSNASEQQQSQQREQQQQQKFESQSQHLDGRLAFALAAPIRVALMSTDGWRTTRLQQQQRQWLHAVRVLSHSCVCVCARAHAVDWQACVSARCRLAHVCACVDLWQRPAHPETNGRRARTSAMAMSCSTAHCERGR